MKTSYENMNDSELVRAVLDRYELTQVSLASMLFISEAGISRALSGRTKVRPAIRERLKEMLVEKDNSEG